MIINYGLIKKLCLSTSQRNNMESQEASIVKHDCNLYSVYRNTDTYVSNECFKCNKILKFQWKSFFKRINNLFKY